MFDKRCVDPMVMDKKMGMENMKGMESGYEANMGMSYAHCPQSMCPPTMCPPMQYDGIVCPVVYECPVERVCHREICHTVPHICPINTRVINHHIYRHTFTPQYTCCEENEKCDVFEGSCSCF